MYPGSSERRESTVPCGLCLSVCLPVSLSICLSVCLYICIQGRQNDVNREFRVARDQGKLIVSPHWLTAVRYLHHRSLID